MTVADEEKACRNGWLSFSDRANFLKEIFIYITKNLFYKSSIYCFLATRKL